MIINNNLAALPAINTEKAAEITAVKPVKPSAGEARVKPVQEDADGISITEKSRPQIQGSDMAVKNAQDGISLLRVADTALKKADDFLHTMRDFSVKAGNDTLTADDRTNIQEEINGLREQLDDISNNTDFSRKKLLNGQTGALWISDDPHVKIHVNGSLLKFDADGGKNSAVNAGANYRIEIRSEPGKAQVQKSNIISVSETMFVESEDDDGSAIEVYYDRELSEIPQFYDSEGKFILSEPQKLTVVQGSGKTASVMIYAEDTLHDTAAKINDAIAFGLGQSEYTDDASRFAVVSDGSAMTAESVLSRSPLHDDNGKITGYDIKSTLVIRSAVQGHEGDIHFAGNDAMINALGLNTIQASQEGAFRVSVFNAHTGEAVATDIMVTGHELNGIIHPNVDVDFDPMAGTFAAWNESGKKYILTADGTFTANIHLVDNAILFQLGTKQNEAFSVQLGNISAEALGVDRVNVMTRELSQKSTGYIDAAIDTVSGLRTQITSYGNAIAQTLKGITSDTGRITDTDYAQSTMRYIEFQILSRAGEAVLSQANQQPEAVFNLLGNS